MDRKSLHLVSPEWPSHSIVLARIYRHQIGKHHKGHNVHNWKKKKKKREKQYVAIDLMAKSEYFKAEFVVRKRTWTDFLGGETETFII